MTQPTESTATRLVPPADLPWGISYLREDIQELRQELRHEVGTLRAEGRDLRAEGRDLRVEITAELRALRGEMNDRFARIDSRLWWQTALILSSWVTLIGLKIMR